MAASCVDGMPRCEALRRNAQMVVDFRREIDDYSIRIDKFDCLYLVSQPSDTRAGVRTNFTEGLHQACNFRRIPWPSTR